MSKQLHGKTAIVTGAAQGIGLAIAQHFAEQGANVMLADKNEKLLAKNIEDFDKEADHVRYFAGDVTQRLVMANLISATLDAFDGIDYLVNAYRYVKDSDPLDTDPSLLEEMLRQNTIAVLRLSQMVAKRMIKQVPEGGRQGEIGAIVNISSLAATRPVPSMLGYSIAAAASEQATRGLALALAPHGIRVNGVSFGSVMSHELKCALKEDSDLRERIITGTPMGRIAGAEDVAETVRFLVSESARFITGQIVTVDGGCSLADPVTAQAQAL